MTKRDLDIDDLKRILRECAGADEKVTLEGDILDATFTDLGYDSLAVLETAGRIEREYGIKLDDDVVTSAETPRSLLEIVNGSQPVAQQTRP
ncbi:acyl carrier protein [Micromonosporaceae bacterium B7E4]